MKYTEKYKEKAMATIGIIGAMSVEVEALIGMLEDRAEEIVGGI